MERNSIVVVAASQAEKKNKIVTMIYHYRRHCVATHLSSLKARSLHTIRHPAASLGSHK